MATLSEKSQRSSEVGPTAAEVRSLLDKIETQLAPVRDAAKDKGLAGGFASGIEVTSGSRFVC